jgi:hypothetical protein
MNRPAGGDYKSQPIFGTITNQSSSSIFFRSNFEKAPKLPQKLLKCASDVHQVSVVFFVVVSFIISSTSHEFLIVNSSRIRSSCPAIFPPRTKLLPGPIPSPVLPGSTFLLPAATMLPTTMLLMVLSGAPPRSCPHRPQKQQQLTHSTKIFISSLLIY